MFSPLIRVAAGRSAEPSQALPSEPWHPVRNSGTKTRRRAVAGYDFTISKSASILRGVPTRQSGAQRAGTPCGGDRGNCVHGAVGPMDDAMRQALVEPAALIESRSAAVLDHALLAGELWTRALVAATSGSAAIAWR